MLRTCPPGREPASQPRFPVKEGLQPGAHTSAHAPCVHPRELVRTRLPRPRPCLARWPHPGNEQNPSGLGSGRRAGSLELKREMRGPPRPGQGGQRGRDSHGATPHPLLRPLGSAFSHPLAGCPEGRWSRAQGTATEALRKPASWQRSGSRVHGVSGAGGVDTPLGSLHRVVTQHTSTPEPGHKCGETPAGPDPGEVLWPQPGSAVTHPHRAHPKLSRGGSTRVPSSGGGGVWEAPPTRTQHLTGLVLAKWGLRGPPAPSWPQGQLPRPSQPVQGAGFRATQLMGPHLQRLPAPPDGPTTAQPHWPGPHTLHVRLDGPHTVLPQRNLPELGSPSLCGWRASGQGAAQLPRTHSALRAWSPSLSPPDPPGHAQVLFGKELQVPRGLPARCCPQAGRVWARGAVRRPPGDRLSATQTGQPLPGHLPVTG